MQTPQCDRGWYFSFWKFVCLLGWAGLGWAGLGWAGLASSIINLCFATHVCKFIRVNQ
jgi:hypothetical protein